MSGKLSREEYRRQKDLDAARKAGTAAPEIDADGNAINPHIPEYMSKAPWYLDQTPGRAGLKHQKKPDDGKVRPGLDSAALRGQKVQAATKFRKGACENCGAMSHKTRDCLERPRRKGARWTGRDIAPDEVVARGGPEDYDSKRDRWAGYDPAEHRRVLAEYEAVEAERRRLREEALDQQTSSDVGAAKKLAKKEKKRSGEDGFGSSDSDDDDEDKYTEKANMPGQKINTDTRITQRNLRIREDRAKYLYNLDLDSAYYDPKTRSMREAPDPSVRPEDAEFAGDNFQRAQGDTLKMQQLQLFAWQSEARGNDVHLQANPTVNELQHREYTQKKEKLRESTKGSILERYGGAEHFDNVPKELLSGQTEEYVEYSRTGQPVRPMHRVTAVPASELERPQLYDGNHTKPWATFFDAETGKYGYDCCHSTVRNSYCTGKAGIEAVAASAGLLTGKAKQPEASKEKGKGRESDARASGSKRRARSSSTSSSGSSSSGSDSSSSSSGSSSSSSDDSRRKRKRSRRHASSREKSKKSAVEGYRPAKHMGEGDVSARLDKEKLKEALRREKGSREEQRSSKSKPDWLSEAEAIRSKNDKHASLRAQDADVTEEQLEAYRMASTKYEDPMANYKDEEA